MTAPASALAAAAAAAETGDVDDVVDDPCSLPGPELWEVCCVFFAFLRAE